MRFYEFEAKQLLAKHRIPLVRSEVANTAAEAEKIAAAPRVTTKMATKVIGRVGRPPVTRSMERIPRVASSWAWATAWTTSPLRCQEASSRGWPWPVRL